MQKARFILDKKKVLEQYEKISCMADLVSFSLKTNPKVASVLEENTEGLFSIHSANELACLRDKKRALFLAQAWDSALIASLLDQGVRWFVVDNEKDLDIFLESLEGLDGNVNLLLRLRLKEMTLRTERYFVFGMESEVVKKRLRAVRKSEKVQNLGIHFHRKTQNMAEWGMNEDFSENFSDCLDIIDVVCIGGGIPAVYANTNTDVVSGILEKISDFRTFLNGNGIRMMAEPGRFIAAPAGKLVTSIKRVYGDNIIVNASVYNTDLDALIVPVKLLVEGEADRGMEGTRPYVIKGMTPCSMDLFRYRVYLPEERVEEGKALVFLNAGAYNFHCDFCSLEKVETEIV